MEIKIADGIQILLFMLLFIMVIWLFFYMLSTISNYDFGSNFESKPEDPERKIERMHDFYSERCYYSGVMCECLDSEKPDYCENGNKTGMGKVW